MNKDNWELEDSAQTFINCILSLIQNIYFKEYIQNMSSRKSKLENFVFNELNIKTQWNPIIGNYFTLIDPSIIPRNIDNIKNIVQLTDTYLFEDEDQIIFDPTNRLNNFKKIIDLHMLYPDESYDLNFPKVLYIIEQIKSGAIVSVFDTNKKICLRFLIRDVIDFYKKLVKYLEDPSVYIPYKNMEEWLSFSPRNEEYLYKFLPMVEDASEIITKDDNIQYIIDTYDFKIESLNDYFLEFLI